jgi:hypothetical protein
MWEALLMLRLIALAVPFGPTSKVDRRKSLALPADFFKDSIRLACAAYRLSLPATRTVKTGKNNDKKNIA